MSARPQRMAAGYFLCFGFVAFALLVWLRGAGRFLIPLALMALVAYGVFRFLQKVREPLP